MARINIEECWWSDPRRTTLILNIGFEADSAAVNMWRVAQEFWGKSRGLVPAEVFSKIRHANALIEAGLADVRGAFIYVRGSSERLEWHAQKREQAAEAGRRSAEVRRGKLGTAQPQGGKGAQESERDPNEIRTDGNGTEPSLSGSLSLSLSLSGSGSQETPIVPLAGDGLVFLRTEFERLAKRYRSEFPMTTTGTRAWDRFRAQFKRPEDIPSLDRSLDNYRLLLNAQDWRSPKASFETYLGTKKSGFFWEQFREMPNLSSGAFIDWADITGSDPKGAA